MESDRARLLQRAELNLQRAQKCRDLIRMIDNPHSIAMLEELARDLEGTAATLQAEAAAMPATVIPGVKAAAREQRKGE